MNDSPVRILHLSDQYPPTLGGLELQVQLLARGLGSQGHHVAVATMALPDAPPFEQDGRVRIHRLSGTSRLLRRFYEQPNRPFHPTVPDPGMVRALRRVVALEKPDIVHAHSWMLNSFLPLKGWSRAKLVVWLHDYALICPKTTYIRTSGESCAGGSITRCAGCSSKQYGALRGIALSTGLRGMTRLYGAVDRFVANSEGVATAVARALQFPPLEIDVVPPGLSPEAFSLAVPQRPKFVPPRGSYLLFVGALGPHKGLDVLLEAYGRLVAPPPLIVVGTRRTDTPKRFPAGVIVVENVPHDEVLAAWAHCAVGIVPSVVREAVGVVALEAMAAGKPVIASNIGGLPDIVEDGITGVLVPPGDVGAICDAVASLLSDAEKREQMGNAARQRARHFSAARLVDRMERVYESVLAGDGTTRRTMWDSPPVDLRSAKGV